MSLWSMLPSPLMYGGNPMRLNTDAWTVALLTNEEVLAVSQDVLGARGRRMASGSNEFWVRDLSGGRKAVAFFNRGTQDATMSATFSQLGVTGTPAIRDLWRRADVTGMTTSLSVSVPGGAALMYTLSPPGTGGTGGAGGATAAPGGAGAAVARWRGRRGRSGGQRGRGRAPAVVVRRAGNSGGAAAVERAARRELLERGGAVGSAGTGGVAGATAGSGRQRRTAGVTGTSGAAGGGAGGSGRAAPPARGRHSR